MMIASTTSTTSLLVVLAFWHLSGNAQFFGL